MNLKIILFFKTLKHCLTCVNVSIRYDSENEMIQTGMTTSKCIPL